MAGCWQEAPRGSTPWHIRPVSSDAVEGIHGPVKYDPGFCLALSGPGPPARKVFPGSQACRKLPSQKGQEVGATSSPGQGRNQISGPGLLVCSFSLVSLELFYRAAFHPVLEITFDLVFVIGRESEAKILAKAVSRGLHTRPELLCCLWRVTLLLCAYLPEWEDCPRIPYDIPHLTSIKRLQQERKLGWVVYVQACRDGRFSHRTNTQEEVAAFMERWVCKSVR